MGLFSCLKPLPLSSFQAHNLLHGFTHCRLTIMSKRQLVVLVALLLSACDMLGLGPDPRIAQKEAEAKAIGGGCRHGLRSIEDCYALNKGINKAAIFEGWREMDAYMRENKIEGAKSEIPLPLPSASAPVPVEEVLTVSKPKAKSAAH
jgi:hypothetical protein